MSDDDPQPRQDGLPDEESLVREMYERVQDLEARVSTLEDEKDSLAADNERLTEENETLKRKVSTLEDTTDALTERVDTIEDEVDDLEWNVNSLTSRADAMNDAIDETQADLTDQAFRVEEKHADLTKRVAGIEHELGLEDWETATALAPNACPLERFASMPDEKRDSELKTPVVRATLVWENFDDWSSPTHKGRVIRSGELRKLLKASTGKKLAWTQVYRVMEEFAENTTTEYQYVDNDSYGKALIRLRNPGDALQSQGETDGGTDGSVVSW